MNSVRQQWVSRIITGLLLALALWFLLQAGMALLSSPEIATAPDTGPVTRNPVSRADSVADSLADRHLFGRSESTDPLGLEQVQRVTDLALTLRGVVAAEDPGSGLAIIAAGRSGEKAYAVGAELPGDATLEAVLPDRVVLNRNGRRETLMLEGSARPGGAARIARPDQDAPAPATRAAVTARPLTSNVPGARGFAININELAASYNLIPAPGGGFRINLGRDADALVATGLHQGDIIRAANGAALDNPALVQQVLAEVLLGKPLSLTVERGGRTITVKPDLETLRKRGAGQ